MNNDNIKTVGVSTPTVKYYGKVTMTYVDKFGRQKQLCLHNSGETGLFAMICRALLGLPVENYKPKTIMAYTGTGESRKNALVQQVTYSSEPVGYSLTNGSWQTDNKTPVKLRYSFIIPGQFVINPSNPIRALKLFNNESALCATIEIDEESAITAESGSNILITWDMSFSNNGDIGIPMLICRSILNLPISEYMPRRLIAYGGDNISNILYDSVPYINTPVGFKHTYVEPTEPGAEGTWEWKVNSVDPLIIRYSFLIPYSLLVQPTEGSATIKEFRIFDNLLQVSQRITLDTTITPSQDSNLILYWDLSFEESNTENEEPESDENT